jgi:hypothetical protein
MGNCGVSSSPDHCAESMTTLAIVSPNRLVAHCFAAYDLRRRRRQI